MIRHSSRLVLFVGLFLAASFLCVTPANLRAQTVSGTILGQIQDQQGAVIGRAEVTAKSLDTGAIRKTTADDSGAYRITSVPAGSYEVSASIAGFKTEVRSGIVVTVGSDVAVNFSLTVGAITEKVEVTGQAPQVDTSSSTLAGFVNSTTIGELPLNGRDWLQLALLQPGANFNPGQNQSDGAHTQRGNGIAISISGGRSTDNAFRIDGMIVNDYANAGPGSALRVNMGVDAIREFSVLTNNYSAEYGRGSGGVINAITKSGTNQFHGSAYGFIRNSALDARNFFDLQTIPPFHRFQFGGAAGGPIKKDKTFFFSNYERLGELKSLSSSVFTLSANARNGILCGNPPSCTSTTQVTVDPRVKPYLAIYPLPNGLVTGNTGIFAYGNGRRGEENYVIGKIDHYISPSTTLTGSYSYDNTTVSVADAFNLKLQGSPARRQNGTVSLQHLFSSSVVNITRAGVSRTFAASSLDCCAKNPAITDPSLGFLPGQNPGSLSVGGVNGSFTGVGFTNTSIAGYTAPQAYDDLSWTKGRHSIRTGFSFERIDYNLFNGGAPLGTWNFASVQALLQVTPTSFSSDFPGSDVNRGMRMSLFGGYIQDDFRILPNLTLNIGVRYEPGTVLQEVNGKMAELRSLADPKVIIGNPYYNNPTLRNFAPRVGFAWDPFKNGKTAVRGGFGVFHVVPLPYLFQGLLSRSAPFYQGGTLSSPPSFSFPNQVAQLELPSSVGASIVEFSPHTPYKMQWNLNIQRQLTRNLALTAGYVGSAGVHLSHLISDTNQVPAPLVTFSPALSSYIFPIPAPGAKVQRINPNFGLIRSVTFSGQSNYHALQANLVQRPARGLTYQLAYTWSKSIDNGTATYTEGGEAVNSVGAPWAFDPRINRGVSDFDIPHNFVANFQYDLPVLSAVKSHGLANAVLGGWQVGGIYTRQSGGPFSLKITSDQGLTGNSNATGSANGAQRPGYAAAPGCQRNAVTGDIGNYIMTQCFAFPALGQLGNLGRGTLRMPVFRNLDFSVFKNQNVWGERLKAQFRVEMFNILNNTNLQPQLRTIFDGTGKLVSSVGTAIAPTVTTSRQIQFGLRLLF